MAILGKPQGIFDLNDSDHCVGSYLLKSDVKEILNVSDEDLKDVEFTNINGNEVCDERKIQKLWYNENRPDKKSSLDEPILSAIIKITYPNIIIERQSRVSRYSMDLKITLDKKEVYIEFDGPSHFAHSQYGDPKNPFIKKQIVEDKTGIEVVNWPYWIQRCSSNVKAIFDKDVKGYGVLWSTEIYFGTFSFPDSAQMIEELTKRFNAADENGYGYFYGPNTRGRNNPEHPIIEKIKNGKKKIEAILPNGYKDIEYWIPQKLMK